MCDLVVEDAEPEPRLPLDELDLLHVPGPGGGVREDLQRPRPGHHALPDNHNVGENTKYYNRDICDKITSPYWIVLSRPELTELHNLNPLYCRSDYDFMPIL